MIKRENEYTLQEVLQELLKAYRIEDKLLEAQLISSWEKVVGGIFAKHTQRLQIKNRILFVSLDSAALRSELAMARSKLVEMLNKEVGNKVIDDIVFR
ncbi:MAG: DUF721 domain-containing protein [Bacteroidales bacterium]|nr:DUF721 domain-containing protein [Bacteroidales bacterium]